MRTIRDPVRSVCAMVGARLRSLRGWPNAQPDQTVVQRGHGPLKA
jgi:hypothetical protein